MLTAILLFLFVLVIAGVINYYGIDKKITILAIRVKLWLRKALKIIVLMIVWSILVAVVLINYLPEEQKKTLIELGRVIDRYFEPERITASSKTESTDKNYWDLYQDCIDRGVRYYTEIGSFPELRYWPNTGKNAVNVAREACQKYVYAYGGFEQKTDHK